ncbi:MAG: hypothetical protein IPK07_09340 [Deltaproteobacteria bacterium]|nr:hypothetical protein [Deltaproteobacteria bacterium]
MDLGWLWEVESGDGERRRRAVAMTLAGTADVRFPARCPACERPPSMIVEVLYEASVRGNLRRLAVPFCAPCAERVLRRFRRVSLAVLASLVVVFGAMAVSSAALQALANRPDASFAALHGARLAPALVAPLALRWIWLAFRKRWFVGVRITSADPAGTRVDLAIDDAAYAAELARLNASVARAGC